MNHRFARHMPLFGEEGQRRIRETRIVLVGTGGVGSHVLQQLAFLGVTTFTIIEPDSLEESNQNRLIGSRWDDDEGSSKLKIAERLVRAIEPGPVLTLVDSTVVSEDAYDAVKMADVVIGCVDKDGPRLILNELCSAYERPYIDVASDVIPDDPPQWGGRVVVNLNGGGCLVCLDEIDTEEAARQIAGPEGEEQRRAIYGIDEDALAGGGPSVVSVNGVVASLAVTEFMAAVTGLRKPVPVLTYRGWQGIVSKRDEVRPDCYYCTGVRGQREQADVERYIRDGVGLYL